MRKNLEHGLNMEMTKYKLGDIAKTGSGGTPKSTVAEYYENGTIPWINSGELNHPFISSTENFITQAGYDNSSAKLFPPQTVLLAMYGATAGKASLLEIEACTNQAVCAIMPDEKVLSPLYLKYKLDTMYNYLVGISTGSARDNLSQEGIRSLELNIHSLAEQKKIAAVLSALDDKIALNKKMNQKLEAMAKRLYDYWFVQFDFPDENGRPYKTSGGPMTHNETLKREIPEGWKVTRLGDLFKTNRGVSYSTPTLGTEGDGVPMINLASFSPNESYNEKGIKYYKGEYTDEKVLKPFDFVMCNTQQTAIDPQKDIIGRSMLVPDIFDGDIVSSHHVNTIKLEKENLKFYLNRLFNTKFYHAYISKFANGTNILGLIFSGVEDYMCEIPSDDLLEKFAKISLDIEKKKSKIIKENQKLTALRDKLLPLLMNGQVVVG